MYYGAFIGSIASNSNGHVETFKVGQGTWSEGTTYDINCRMFIPTFGEGSGGYYTSISEKLYSMYNAYIDKIICHLSSTAIGLIMAKNKGSMYGIESYTKRWYILGLLMLVCKARDIQNSIGYGTHLINGGWGYQGNGGGYGDRTKYLFFGSNASTDTPKENNTYYGMVKCFGIECFWGGPPQACEGFVAGKIKYNAPYSYNLGTCSTRGDTQIPCNWTWVSSPDYEISENINGYITDYIVASNNSCLIPSVSQSDYTKGWTDKNYIIKSNINHIIFGVVNCGTSKQNYLLNGPFTVDCYGSNYRASLGYDFKCAGCRLIAA